MGTLPGGDTSQALAINNDGLAVGFSTVSSGDRHAFLWSASAGMKDLGTLPGDRASEAHRINSPGDVIGSSTGPGGTHAFLWTAAGGMQNLGGINGNASNAIDFNNSDQVVGVATTAMGGHAFVWSASTGMVDLNSVIPANAGVILTSAVGINNAGAIVAIGAVTSDHSQTFELDDTHAHPGQIHAFLLVPVS